MKQLFKLTDLIGRCITNVHKGYDDITFRFADDTLVKFIIDEEQEGFRQSRYKVLIDDSSISDIDEALT